MRPRHFYRGPSFSKVVPRRRFPLSCRRNPAPLMSCCDPCVPCFQCPMYCMVKCCPCCIFTKGPPNPKSCGFCPCPMNCLMDCVMACPCCASRESGGMASPCMAKSMQPLMRYMMDALMKITVHDNDPTCIPICVRILD